MVELLLDRELARRPVARPQVRLAADHLVRRHFEHHVPPRRPAALARISRTDQSTPRGRAQGSRSRVSSRSRVPFALRRCSSMQREAACCQRGHGIARLVGQERQAGAEAQRLDRELDPVDQVALEEPVVHGSTAEHDAAARRTHRLERGQDLGPWDPARVDPEMRRLAPVEAARRAREHDAAAVLAEGRLVRRAAHEGPVVAGDGGQEAGLLLGARPGAGMLARAAADISRRRRPPRSA